MSADVHDETKVCEACDGSGIEDPTGPITCQVCNGSGRVPIESDESEQPEMEPVPEDKGPVTKPPRGQACIAQFYQDYQENLQLAREHRDMAFAAFQAEQRAYDMAFARARIKHMTATGSKNPQLAQSKAVLDTVKEKQELDDAKGLYEMYVSVVKRESDREWAKANNLR